MALVLYNTLTKRKESLEPLHKGKLGIYVCGVTVYDQSHLGHAKSAINFDVIVRWLRHRGFDVNHITNFTDVDDKIIARANEMGIDPLRLSQQMIDEYFRDMDALRIRRASVYPTASDSMDDTWGKGRRGWHIECSARCLKHIGKTVDIHGGGTELIFPHHENEILQSEAYNDAPFVRYWMHKGFLTLDQEQMSKSLKNFFLSKDILLKHTSGTVRFYLLNAQYSQPLDYNEKSLEEAGKALERLQNTYSSMKAVLTTSKGTDDAS